MQLPRCEFSKNARDGFRHERMARVYGRGELFASLAPRRDDFLVIGFDAIGLVGAVFFIV